MDERRRTLARGLLLAPLAFSLLPLPGAFSVGVEREAGEAAMWIGDDRVREPFIATYESYAVNGGSVHSTPRVFVIQGPSIEQSGSDPCAVLQAQKVEAEWDAAANKYVIDFVDGGCRVTGEIAPATRHGSYDQKGEWTSGTGCATEYKVHVRLRKDV